MWRWLLAWFRMKPIEAACPACGIDAHWHGRQVNANGTEWSINGCECPEMDSAHRLEP